MEMIDQPPIWEDGKYHFKYCLKFRIASARSQELKDYLDQLGLSMGQDVRLSPENDRIFDYANRINPQVVGNVFLSFKLKSKAMLFKLSWEECEPSQLNVIIPLIRRVMPNIIANEILGVQPMTGPPSRIFPCVKNSSGAEPSSIQDEVRPGEPSEPGKDAPLVDS